MSQLVRIPDGMRYMDMLEARIAALERRAGAERITTQVPVYTTGTHGVDRDIDPSATTINELATVLGTLIDDMKAAGLIKTS